MIITLPFKTPTCNHLYWHRGNIKILTKEAREVREKITGIINKIDKYKQEKIYDTKLKVEIAIHENWFTKKDEVKKKDVANRSKFLIDSVFKALEIDDKFIWIHTMRKVQSTEEKAVIKIEAI